MKPYRSFLFVPGHQRSWVPKAVRAGADAIVLDLEDSVPDHERERARSQIPDAVEELTAVGEDRRPGILIRTNPLKHAEFEADLELVRRCSIDALFLPKVRMPEEIAAIDIHFADEPGGGPELMVPTETIEAIQNCERLATASPRIGSMIGSTAEHADITGAVGFEWTSGGLETLYIRSRILIAAKGAGLHPVTALWERVHDLDGLADFARAGRRLGYRGQIVIHPSHVPVVNEVFGPDPERISFYLGLLRTYEEAAAAGNGAVVYSNVHIDEAHAATAREWLADALKRIELDRTSDHPEVRSEIKEALVHE